MSDKSGRRIDHLLCGLHSRIGTISRVHRLKDSDCVVSAFEVLSIVCHDAVNMHPIAGVVTCAAMPDRARRVRPLHGINWRLCVLLELLAAP